MGPSSHTRARGSRGLRATPARVCGNARPDLQRTSNLKTVQFWFKNGPIPSLARAGSYHIIGLRPSIVKITLSAIFGKTHLSQLFTSEGRALRAQGRDGAPLPSASPLP